MQKNQEVPKHLKWYSAHQKWVSQRVNREIKAQDKQKWIQYPKTYGHIKFKRNIYTTPANFGGGKKKSDLKQPNFIVEEVKEGPENPEATEESRQHGAEDNESENGKQ